MKRIALIYLVFIVQMLAAVGGQRMGILTRLPTCILLLKSKKNPYIASNHGALWDVGKWFIPLYIISSIVLACMHYHIRRYLSSQNAMQQVAVHCRINTHRLGSEILNLVMPQGYSVQKTLRGCAANMGSKISLLVCKWSPYKMLSLVCEWVDFSNFSQIWAKIDPNLTKSWKNQVILLKIFSEIGPIGIWLGHSSWKSCIWISLRSNSAVAHSYQNQTWVPTPTPPPGVMAPVSHGALIGVFGFLPEMKALKQNASHTLYQLRCCVDYTCMIHKKMHWSSLIVRVFHMSSLGRKNLICAFGLWTCILQKYVVVTKEVLP